jgi:Cys-rich repeat protein
MRGGIVLLCCAWLLSCASSVHRPGISDGGTPDDSVYQGSAGVRGENGGGNAGATGGGGSGGSSAAGSGGHDLDAGPLPCESDDDCSEYGLRCDRERGYCVECLEDGDCPLGYHCDSGQCLVDGAGSGGHGGSMDAGDSCGNGLIDEGSFEHCDGANLGGESCSSLGYGGGQLLCSEGCTFDVSMCTLVPDSGYGQ